MSTNPHPDVRVIENLEPKLAPAGTVLLSTLGGILTITGDAANNGIAITDVPGTQGPGTPGTGAWEISDPTATFTTFILNGTIMAAPFSIPAQNGIKATLGDADDRIDIIPSTNPSGMLLSGALNLNTGKGNDTVNLGNGAGQHLIVGGATTVDLGTDGDTLAIQAAALFNGSVSILGGTGNDAISLASSGSHLFAKGVTIDLGAGSDSLVVLSDRFEALSGAVTIKGAGQAAAVQTVNLSPTAGTTAGTFAITLGAGDLDLDFGVLGSEVWRIGGGLNITAGAGNDSVHLDATVTVAGALAVDLKAGNNDFLLDAGRALQAGAMTLKGAAGNDTVSFGAGSTLLVAGALSLNLGAGLNAWNSDAGHNLTAGSLNLQGGVGDDTVSWNGANLTILGNAVLALGAGTNSTTLAPTVGSFIGGSLSVSGLGGSDTVSLDSPIFRVLNHVTFSLGDGGNQSSTDGALFHAGGNLTYTGGKGDDVLNATNTDFIIGRTVSFSGGEAAAGNELELAVQRGSLGAVTFKGGNGYDQLILGAANGTGTDLLTISGAINAVLGGGNANLSLTDVSAHGNLTVAIASLAGQSDAVLLNQSTINGTVLINQGAGSSSLTVEDSLLRAAFTANLGAGADTLMLDAAAGSSAFSTWFGVVRINAGAGADALTIGSPILAPLAGNNFYKNVFVDGGADLDVLAQGNNTFFAGSTLTQQNIP